MNPIHQANDNLQSYLKEVDKMLKLIEKKQSIIKKILNHERA